MTACLSVYPLACLKAIVFKLREISASNSVLFVQSSTFDDTKKKQLVINTTILNLGGYSVSHRFAKWCHISAEVNHRKLLMKLVFVRHLFGGAAIEVDWF